MLDADKEPTADKRIPGRGHHSAMMPYVTNIEETTKENENFRQVLFTGQHEQLVVMTLQPGEEIGMEVHHDTDQFFRVEKGEGTIIFGSEERPFAKDDAALVPAGTQHNIVNTSATKPLKLYTLYSPPKHADGTIHATKAEAEAAGSDESHAPRAARHA